MIEPFSKSTIFMWKKLNVILYGHEINIPLYKAYKINVHEKKNVREHDQNQCLCRTRVP